TTLVHGPMRDRLFDIACTFAVKLQRNDAAGTEVIVKLFDRARISSDTPQQRVRYLSAHAQYLRIGKDAAAELALHQQILSEPALRAVSVAGKSGASTAAAEAEANIIELLKANPTIYAAYEARAAEKLAAIIAKPDIAPADLLAVADEYPIDKTGFAALRQAAEILERQGQARESVQTLRRLLQHARSKDERIHSLESLARIYAAMPGQLELAIVRLKQAAELDPRKVLSKPIAVNKTTVIINEPLDSALASLKIHRNGLAGQALPTFKLPNGIENPGKSPLLPAETVNGIKAIIRQQQPVARTDRIVALKTDSKIVQFQSGSIKPLNSPVKVDEVPIGCAYGGDILVVVSQAGITAIHRDSGGEAWRFALPSLPAAELAGEGIASGESELVPDDADVPAQVNLAMRDPRLNVRGRQIIINGQARFGMVALEADEENPPDEGGPERIAHFRVLSDRVVFATNEGRVVCLDLGKGTLLWQARLSDQSLRHFQAIDDFVVVSVKDAIENSDVFVLDTIGGRIVKHIRYTVDHIRSTQPQGQLVNLVLSGDGVLVLMMTNRLEGIDLFDPAAPKVQQKPQAEPAFLLSAGPEQLVITDDRVLALYLSGSGQQSVRAYELRSLRPLRTGDAGIEASFASGVAANNERGQALSIRTAGAAFYIVGPKSLAAYHLDKGWDWKALLMEQRDRGASRDMFVTQDYCVLLHVPAGANVNAPKVPRIQLSAYSRAVVD
ncbi:MAG: PQQ-binding-like beta-propeller repeat protein, partial [Burkholderiales bacterium]|nr:PQQ-binding-like beta-propeller repeat protein [Phycisphaerae bacterium]